MKQGDSGSKEAQTQGEEKESCSDEEKKSKENTDAEGEQSTNTGTTMKTHSGRRISSTVQTHYPELIQFPSIAALSHFPKIHHNIILMSFFNCNFFAFICIPCS